MNDLFVLSFVLNFGSHSVILSRRIISSIIGRCVIMGGGSYSNTPKGRRVEANRHFEYRVGLSESTHRPHGGHLGHGFGAILLQQHQHRGGPCGGRDVDSAPSHSHHHGGELRHVRCSIQESSFLAALAMIAVFCGLVVVRGDRQNTQYVLFC